MPEGPSWCVLVTKVWKSPGGVCSICSACCRSRGSLLFLCLGKAKAQAAGPGSGSKPVLLKSRSPRLIKPSSSRLWRSECLPRAWTQEALEGPFCVVVLSVKHKWFVLGDHQKLTTSLSCEFSSPLKTLGAVQLRRA